MPRDEGIIRLMRLLGVVRIGDDAHSFVVLANRFVVIPDLLHNEQIILRLRSTCHSHGCLFWYFRRLFCFSDTLGPFFFRRLLAYGISIPYSEIHAGTGDGKLRQSTQRTVIPALSFRSISLYGIHRIENRYAGSAAPRSYK